MRHQNSRDEPFLQDEDFGQNAKGGPQAYDPVGSSTNVLTTADPHGDALNGTIHGVDAPAHRAIETMPTGANFRSRPCPDRAISIVRLTGL